MRNKSIQENNFAKLFQFFSDNKKIKSISFGELRAKKILNNKYFAEDLILFIDTMNKAKLGISFSIKDSFSRHSKRLEILRK